MRNLRNGVVFTMAMAGVVGLGSVASAQSNPIPSHDVDVNFDSGILFNLGTEPEVVWNDVIEIENGQWLRLQFGDMDLGFDPMTGRGSVLRIVSMLDGAEQTLDTKSARQWANTSAYFNGDAVAIELLAYPNGMPNRVVVDVVVVGEIPNPDLITTICDGLDDRLPSDDVRAGRGLPAGCTSWLFNDKNHTMLTAGHCTAAGNTVVEFNVPLSNSNGSIIHPGPEDQYSVDPFSVQYVNGGVGNDWSYFGCYENSETGQTAWETQGDAYVIDIPGSPQGGDEIRITGYGTTGNGVPREWNQAQKTHVGPYAQLSGSAMGYRTDTSGGNSGSPVIFEDTGNAVGIHTHGGCGNGSGHNSGTGLNNAGFQNALANPKGVCKSRGCVNLTVTNLVAGQKATFTVSEGERGSTTAVLWSGDLGSFVFEGGGWCVDFGIQLPANKPQSRILGQGYFDQDGVFSKVVSIPGNISGMDLAFQAAVQGTCPDDCMSDVIEETVQ